MTEGNIITIIIFLMSQITAFIWTVSTLKGDGRVIKAQMYAMQQDIEQVSQAMVTLANVRAEIMIMNERSLLQGKRIDDISTRLNRLLEHQVLGHPPV